MTLPVRNATLTSVTGVGTSEDFDSPATLGAVKWSGSERVFWSEVTEREQPLNRTELVVRRYLIVEEALPVDWEAGDTIAVSYRGAARTGTVRDVSVTTADRLAGVVRLILEEA